MVAFSKLGLLCPDKITPELRHSKSWVKSSDCFLILYSQANAISTILNNREISRGAFAEKFGIPKDSKYLQRILHACDWQQYFINFKRFNCSRLGLTSESEPFISRKTVLDSFCNLLQKKMQYKPDERDMAFMQHQFLVRSSSGKKSRMTSTLIEYGQPGGYSAMARTVGLPVAVATELVLNGTIRSRGVLGPLGREIYSPVLKRLEGLGICFKEQVSLVSE